MFPSRRLSILAPLAGAVVALALLSGAGANGGQGSAWTIMVQPIEPEVGQTIAVRAAALGDGGIPKYVLQLDGAEPPVLRLDTPASVQTQFLGEEVSWELTGLRAGSQTFAISVDYEKQICDDPKDPQTCHYQFFADQSPEVKVLVPAPDGDADCSGHLNAIDATLTLQHDAALLAQIPCAVAADPTGDGAWNSLDAALILQRVAGLIPRSPA